MNVGSIVVIHLSQPNEKFWGVLEHLSQEGVTIRGINLNSFEDWMRGVAREEASLGLSTMFVPLFRVQRIFLDEQTGEVRSFQQRFEREVGESVEAYLGRRTGDDEDGFDGGLVS